MSYLIDTHVISEFVRKRPNKKVLTWFGSIPSDSLHLSVLTFGEIRKGIEKIDDTHRKEKLRIWLEHELPNWFGERILSIDLDVVDRWGRLLAEVKRPIPAIDSLIAATALHFDLALVTRNTIDFDYSSLQIINPWL